MIVEKNYILRTMIKKTNKLNRKNKIKNYRTLKVLKCKVIISDFFFLHTNFYATDDQKKEEMIEQ